ncbi:MAG: ATP-binding cassette domain-containing protein, partial [candidate division NC10 bacterium]|nr:ATP-binding cassette domain-containing protein [candidate division NC10 bacterium]
MLEVEGIHTFYGPSHVLQGVSLTVREGEVVCLLGRNGAGKTTTLRSIIGLTPPRRGSVRFLGREMMGRHPYRVARMGIGYVDQGRRIFPGLSVDENLEVAENGRKGPWTKAEVYRVFPELV